MKIMNSSGASSGGTSGGGFDYSRPIAEYFEHVIIPESLPYKLVVPVNGYIAMLYLVGSAKRSTSIVVKISFDNIKDKYEFTFKANETDNSSYTMLKTVVGIYNDMYVDMFGYSLLYDIGMYVNILESTEKIKRSISAGKEFGDISFVPYKCNEMTLEFVSSSNTSDTFDIVMYTFKDK